MSGDSRREGEDKSVSMKWERLRKIDLGEEGASDDVHTKV